MIRNRFFPSSNPAKDVIKLLIYLPDFTLFQLEMPIS